MISLPAFLKPVENPVPPPEGAPLRPGEWSSMMLAFFFGVATFYTLGTNKPPIFAITGVLGMLAVFIFKFFQRRHYDRIGWYEKHETVALSLPFIIRMSLHPIIPNRSFMLTGEEKVVFGDETINLGGVYTVHYSQIREVHTNCERLCLKGITIHLVHNPVTESINELPIPDYCKGERTRKILAILRVKARYATFTGPQWVEEGWVPRLGFSCPSSPHGGGGP
ncbi:hypothetical protein IAD21_02936 [Abditibacteriota bacterium]|nr:hypothetical protein IAD21_02936 [Abditibacteriota bacterium]